MKKFYILLLCLTALFTSCNKEEYILQIFTGGWNNSNYTTEQIIARIEEVSEMVPVGKVIIGWNLDKDPYIEIGNYLHSKNIEMILWMPVFSEIGHIEEAEQSVDIWGCKTESYNLQEGEDFTFYCPSSPLNIQAVKNIYEKHFSDCGFDGVFLDKIRTASYVAGLSGVLSCGCERCTEFYEKHGFDVEQFRNAPQEQLEEFFNLKSEIISESVAELEDWFHSKDMIVGLDLFAPAIAQCVGQDYEALSRNADFIKPMMYRITDAPAGIGFEMRAFDPDFDNSVLTEEYLVEELQKAVSLSHCPVYPGLEVNYREDIARTSPEYVKECARALRKAGLKGAVLAWDVMLAPDENIAAFAE